MLCLFVIRPFVDEFIVTCKSVTLCHYWFTTSWQEARIVTTILKLEWTSGLCIFLKKNLFVPGIEFGLHGRQIHSQLADTFLVRSLTMWYKFQSRTQWGLVVVSKQSASFKQTLVSFMVFSPVRSVGLCSEAILSIRLSINKTFWVNYLGNYMSLVCGEIVQKSTNNEVFKIFANILGIFQPIS